MTELTPLQHAVSMKHGDPRCEASVTREWIEDECGKPATTVVRQYLGGEIITYPTCTYHAHVCGVGASVPLADIVSAVKS